jgi:hypothetical protein
MFNALHELTDVADAMVRLSAAHEVDFSPPELTGRAAPIRFTRRSAISSRQSLRKMTSRIVACLHYGTDLILLS